MNALKIFKPSSRRFWVCRASAGKYLDHFLEHQVICLGHIDSLSKLNNIGDKPRMRKLVKDVLDKKYPERRRTATNHLNQILHFLFDAKEGDLIFSLNARTVHVGKIKSVPFYDKTKLYIEKTKAGNLVDVPMSQYLRRKVDWFQKISRSKLPYSLSKGITGNQTFFNLDEYENEIYSIMSPYVYKDDELSVNLFLNKKNEISAYDYSKLSIAFIKSEFIASEWEALFEKVTIDDLEKRFVQFCRGGSSASVVAEFSSPGRTSFTSRITFNRAVIVAVLFSTIVSGGDLDIVFLKAKINPLIPENARERFWDSFREEGLDVINKWLQKDSLNIDQNLQIKYPEVDTDNIA